MKMIIKPLLIILASCLLFGQEKSNKPASKIAYAGVKIENVEPWVKKELSRKIQNA